MICTVHRFKFCRKMCSTTTTSGVVVRKFGGPEVLELDREIRLPELGDKQVNNTKKTLKLSQTKYSTGCPRKKKQP